MGPKRGSNSDKRYPTGPGFYAARGMKQEGNNNSSKRKNPKLGSEVGLEEED